METVTAMSLRRVRVSMPRATDKSRATTKLILAIGMAMLASPRAIANSRKFTIKKRLPHFF